MSYGNFNNNDKKGPYSPNTYSSYKFNNARSSVDKTQLSISYWGNSMRVMIAPKTSDSPDDQPRFDHKNSVSAYLNYAKAKMFHDILLNFLADPKKYDNYGVVTGGSLISVSTGKDFGSQFPLIIIRRVEDDGRITASFAYEIKGDHYFNVCGFTENNSNFEKEFLPNMELELLATALEQYYQAESRAVAFTVLDEFKWEHNRTTTRLMRIGEKLGVDMSISGNGAAAKGSSGSFFSRGSGSSSGGGFGDGYTSSATLDDLDG